jgi:hypothetical protein
MVNKEQLAAQNALIEELKALIVDLQKKVANLEKKQQTYDQFKGSEISDAKTWSEVVINGRKKSQYQASVLNAVGSEQKLRKQKERSVIVFGLPAPTGGTPEEMEKKDKEKVSEIFEFIVEKGFGGEVEKVRRFKTQADSSKIAPLQVIMKLSNGNEPLLSAIEIAKRAKSLKSNTNFSNIFINPDLTQSQQIHLKMLIQERKEKNSQLSSNSQFYYGIRGDAVVRVEKKN